DAKKLARFQELNLYFNSPQFKADKLAITGERFAGSPEERAEKELKKLKADAGIKTFFKINNSDTLNTYNKASKSKELEEYKQLEAFLVSADFTSIEQYYKQPATKRYTDTKLHKSEQDFKELQHNIDIINYFKFIKHKAFKDYSRIKGSETLKKLEELKVFMGSGEVEKLKSSLKKSEFQASEANRKLQEYKVRNKSKEIKNYYKLAHSPLIDAYIKIQSSNELEAYNSLNEFLNSSAFKEEKKAFMAKGFKDTPEFEKKMRFNALKKDPLVKHFHKFGSSKEFAVFQEVALSDQLAKHNALEEQTNSAAFKARKAYLKLSGDEKYKKSDLFAKQEEHKALLQDEDILFFLKREKTNKFKPIEEWRLTFEDDFKSNSLSPDKWIDRYYWGNKLIADTYSLAYDKHMYLPANVTVNANYLQLITKNNWCLARLGTVLTGFSTNSFLIPAAW
ncbi:MAG: hypothetical protein HC896_17090, partial [Bacteroidales bacterium]|nr:hypothetical protein [Bacteroidales bacterium]